MSGWDKKYGELVDQNTSEDEYWYLLNYVFSDSCRKTNTYKFGLIKSICDQIYTSQEFNDYYFLSYESIFEKFAENYWNLVNKYKLRQMMFNGKSEYSKIERILSSAYEKLEVPDDLDFSVVNDNDKKDIVRVVTTECKRCVIGALYCDFEGKLYAFDLRGNGLQISKSAYSFISKYKMEIERLNYYSWARFLERVNDDDALTRVLEKLELATPQRQDLSIYRRILLEEFAENKCFYCGKRIDNKNHVDHFIPWSFVKSDNLWNLVMSCPRCNILKKDNLVNRNYISAIEERNQLIISSDVSKNYRLEIEKEFTGYRAGLLYKMWDYARMSGIREKENLFI